MAWMASFHLRRESCQRKISIPILGILYEPKIIEFIPYLLPISAELHLKLMLLFSYCSLQADIAKPIYALAADKHPTMTSDRYMPKGSWENPHPRSWKKIEAWTPPPAKGTH